MRDLHLATGTSTEGALLEATRRLDEERRPAPEAGDGAAAPLESLERLIASVPSPALGAETSSLLLLI